MILKGFGFSLFRKSGDVWSPFSYQVLLFTLSVKKNHYEQFSLFWCAFSSSSIPHHPSVLRRIVIVCKTNLAASKNEVYNFFFLEHQTDRQTDQTVQGHLEPRDCLPHKSENKFIIRIAQFYVLFHDAVMAPNDDMISEQSARCSYHLSISSLLPRTDCMLLNCCFGHTRPSSGLHQRETSQFIKKNSVALVRKRTIPTERPPLSAK
jgi:hypothetical protein